MLVGALAVVVALAAGGAALLWTNLGTRGAAPPTQSTVATTVPPSQSGEPPPAGESTLAGEPTPAGESTPAEEPVRQEPTRSPAQSGQGNLRIPAAFAGTWEGTADSEMLDKKFEDEPVSITLKEGESTGTWHAPGEDAGCDTGTLQVTEVSGKKLSFRLGGLGGLCAVYDSAGGMRVTLERTDDDEADYRLTMPMGGRSDGELKRAG